MNDTIDTHRFWEERHVELRDDHRNVGNRGLSSEQNLQMIASKAALIMHRLGMLGVKSGASVLDAGCGAGVLTSMLAPSGLKLYGNDVSPTAIAAAEQTMVGEFVVASLSEVGFDRTFDVVLCLDVLFHVVDDRDWYDSVQSLFGATVDNGFLVIVEHFPGSGAAQAPHCKWRSVDSYQQALPDALWLEISQFSYPGNRNTKTLLIAQRPVES